MANRAKRKLLPYVENVDPAALDDDALKELVARMNDQANRSRRTAGEVIRSLEKQAIEIIESDIDQKRCKRLEVFGVHGCDGYHSWQQWHDQTIRQKTMLEMVAHLRWCNQRLDSFPESSALVLRLTRAMYWIMTEAVRPIEGFAVSGIEATERGRALNEHRRANKFALSKSELLKLLQNQSRRYPGKNAKELQRDVAKSLRTSDSTVARLCREHGITAVEYRKKI